MAELKTKANQASVSDFLNKITDKQKLDDCKTIVKLMTSATKAEPKMWGPAIVGFGDRHLKYESGRELDWFQIGFSPRKQNITLYLMGGAESREKYLKKLGKYKTGKSCLYINALKEIDMEVFREMINASVKAKS